MQIAIHHRPGSFSDKWIEYCDQHNVHYKLVDCYASDIIGQLQDCDGLMWHWSHGDHRDILFARQLTYSLEIMGKKVFPDSTTCWHFDDKVGQKYLLEAIGAPLVPSYVFYDKRQALDWAKKTTYPKVFKLRGGAGSENVRLVNDHSKAKQFINRAFSKGFKAKNRMHLFKNRLWHFRRDRDLKSLLNIGKGIGRLIIPTNAEKHLPVEKNYVYFQDMYRENDHDIRVNVIGKRAFAIKRMVRDDDFRASGSGKIIYATDQIPGTCIALSFLISKQLRSQCLTYDFVFQGNTPLVVEISYGFSQDAYIPCPGYWNDNLQLIEGQFNPEYFMIEDFIQTLAH